MNRRRGSNQHRVQWRWSADFVRSFWTIIALVAVACLVVTKLPKEKAISPLADPVYAWSEPTPTPTPDLSVDQLVDKYAKIYGKTPAQENRIKVLLHFLLYKEAGYGSNKNCGDGGRACGPLQFHEPTYQGYRKIMIQRGLVDRVGSRWNMENAIETTAWAIADGREDAWGPLLRNEIQI